jgi:hypothetical protein
MGLDTKTYGLTDRQSQCDFDFDLNIESYRLVAEEERPKGQFSVGARHGQFSVEYRLVRL